MSPQTPTASAVIDGLAVPLLGAPMAGGPSTPALAAAVTAAGGLGGIAGGYLGAARIRARIDEARSLTPGPLLLNLFVPEQVLPDPADVARFAAALAPWAEEAGLPVPEPAVVDQVAEARELEAILAAVLDPAAAGIDVLTTTFGMLSAQQARRVHDAGIELGVTVSSPQDAAAALALSPDLLIVLGPEAGGHRSTFRQDEEPSGLPLRALLAEVLALLGAVDAPADHRDAGAVRRPALVAAGGVASREDVRELLAAGADAVQVGTLLLPADEAGTRPAHARALGGDGPTVVTRVFSGRPARALENRTTRELGPHAVVGYPHVHRMTSPLRARAGEDAGRLNLWAGTGHRAARPGSAAEIIGRLAP